jgi:transposase InsO family protein/transposase-like protein
MYSREKRIKAIELYIKYDRCAADVIRELGYPDRKSLKKWYVVYLQKLDNGNPWEKIHRKSRYSDDQKAEAVKHYLEHGRRKSRTVRALGYPSREVLRQWIDELAPETRKKRAGSVQCSQEQKANAVIAMCTRTGNAESVAKDFGVSREALYKWKNSLIGKEDPPAMPDEKIKSLKDEVEGLRAEAESLKKQVKTLKLEVDVLKGTAALIKKGPGVDPKNLTNREKAVLVDALKQEHSLKEALKRLEMARSSYFYHRRISQGRDRYEELRRRVRGLFEDNNSRYGYRRIHALLKRDKFVVSEKVVRHLMMEENLVVACKKKRKYSSYQGDESFAAVNLIERDFRADAPNEKWLTDITEFSIPAGKVYLSPVVDCFDGMVTSWTIGTNPDADLVNTMLDQAILTLKDGEHPLIHSDQGGHYRWPGWVERMKERNLDRSMSRKGYAPDNAACEGFFGRLKNEMFYFRSWIGVGIEEFINILHEYLIWYNEKRIKLSLGGMSPLEYRRSLGYVV